MRWYYTVSFIMVLQSTDEEEIHESTIVWHLQPLNQMYDPATLQGTWWYLLPYRMR